MTGVPLVVALALAVAVGVVLGIHYDRRRSRRRYGALSVLELRARNTRRRW